jgi:hypothetical protein
LKVDYFTSFGYILSVLSGMESAISINSSNAAAVVFILNPSETRRW